MLTKTYLKRIAQSFLFLFTILFLPYANAELNLELPGLNLPTLGGQSNRFITASKARQQGFKTLRAMRRSNQTVEDPEINLWIRSLGNKLVSNAPQSSTPLYFIISKKQSINAFATFGGVIVVNIGLILETDTESELAAVLAHEIAHVTQNHISRMLEKASANKFATSAAVFAGILASSKDPQAGQAILSATLATMAHKQLSFSREAETEADRVGLRILSRSGFNPIGMPSFLKKLERFNNKKNISVTEYLRSHPLTFKRIVDTQNRAKRLGVFHRRENSNYLYMREKLRYLVQSNTSSPNNLPINIKRYAKAEKLNHQRNYALALKFTSNFSKKIPEVLLITELQNKQRKYQQTIRILKPLVAIYPGDEALSISLANAYLGVRQAKQAWLVLNDVTVSEQTSLEYFDIYQKAAKFSGKTSQAYRAVANRNIRIGSYKAAAYQLRQAMKFPDATGSELLLMQKELSIVEDLLEESQRKDELQY